MENYYKILHVADFAEIEVVKAAYRAVSKLYHPDINSDVDSSEIVKINLAYEVIGNPEKKESYDRELRNYMNEKSDHSAFASDKKSEPVNDMKSDIVESFTSEPKTKAGKFAQKIGKGLWTVVDTFLEGAREFQKEAENTYYAGNSLDDYTLVRKYLKSTGAQRNGYAQVLMDRGLLYKEGDKLVPSYSFIQIARNI